MERKYREQMSAWAIGCMFLPNDFWAAMAGPVVI
jgi:hypothetical protein